MNSYKLGINLGWHKEEANNQEIFNQYKSWLNICHENKIRLVRIFLTRWSINALFDNNKINLLLKIIQKADNLNVEVILVLNHFTDFINQHYRDLDETKYIWKTYPFKKKSIKDFFVNLDKEFIESVKNVLDKIKRYKNITQIELFNEIDLVNINSKTLIKWTNEFVGELSTYQERYKFCVSIANHDNLKLFKNSLHIAVDVHIYNFPFEYAFKNIEYFKDKLNSNSYFGEYAKFSDNSHLELCESKSYFCSGLWGSYLHGLRNSPLHWWWEELLVNNAYLKIISLFQKHIPKNFNFISSDNFRITDLKVIAKEGNNSIRRDKILFRLKILILHPTYLKHELRSIIKFLKKILLSYNNKEEIFIRGFENKEYFYFYCESKNCQRVSFNLCVNKFNKIKTVEEINLLTGKIQQKDYEEIKDLFKLQCSFSSNHLIKIKKFQYGLDINKPTILFISKFIPSPAFDGGALRNKAWLEFYLKKYHVVLVGFWNKKYGNTRLEDLKHDNLKIHGINLKSNSLRKFYLLFKLLFLNKSFLLSQYYNKQLEKKVFEIISKNKIDFVFCSELSTMQYINNLDKTLPIYFDDHNVEFRLIERISKNKHGLKKFILRKESKLIKNFEYMCIKNSVKTLVVSLVDKEFLFNSFSIESENIKVVHNVFEDHGGFKQDNLSDVPRLVFVGNLNWAPNKDGLFHFLTKIFPKVLEKIPNTELAIIGSNLPQTITNRSKNLPVNFFEEISNNNKEKIISSAWIGIVPLYFASGSRIKILEFWSHGKCVVTTNVGLEGLPCPDGTLTADSDQEFVDQLINILKHKEKLQTLGSSNYSVFKQNYLKKVVYEDTLYNTFSAE